MSKYREISCEMTFKIILWEKDFLVLLDRINLLGLKLRHEIYFPLASIVTNIFKTKTKRSGDTLGTLPHKYF